VPSRNGSVTAAPGGGHNIQAGATEDAAAAAGVAVVDDEVPRLLVATAPVAPGVDVEADTPALSAVAAVRAAAGPATVTSSDSAIKNRRTIDRRQAAQLPVLNTARNRALPLIIRS
jgi:hypothetical protein